MRLAGQIKLGYYPTPPRVGELIKERLTFAGPYAALDPCCGEGDALAQLTEGTECTRYGIEPENGRAAAAREKLDRVLHSTREDARISHGAFSLILLNPPYDEHHEESADGEKKTTRKEIWFLQQCLPLLAPGGVLVFIVPAHILNAEIRLYLSQKLDGLEVWHFPEPERSEFGQAVAIGTRSAEKRVNPCTVQVADDPPDAPPHVVPVSARDLKIWKTVSVNPAELAALAQNSPLFRLFSGAPTAQQRQARRPPLSLHAGHLSLLIASGAVDGLTGNGAERHVLRGKTTKYSRVSQDTSFNDETGSTTTTTRSRDAYRVSVKVLRPDGRILELE